MRAQWSLRAIILLILVEGLALAPLRAMTPQTPGAAQVEVGSEDGLQDPPGVTEGEDITTEEEFNPTITCTIGPGDTIDDLIECLVDELLNPPPPCHPENPHAAGNYAGPWGVMISPGTGEECVPVTYDRSDFIVTALPAPSFGVEISRVDGFAMERILFRENDPGIQTTEIRIDNTNRRGRIGGVTELPACNGTVFVSVNDVSIAISTALYCSSYQINAKIVDLLRARGFLVIQDASYIHITGTGGSIDGGIRRLQFRSTDSGIAASDLALLLPSDPAGIGSPQGRR